MDRAAKEKELAYLRDEFANVEGLVLSSVKGLTVSEVSTLRGQLHEAGVNYRVVKNTLAKKALEGTDLDVLSDDFKQETAVAWSANDAVAPFKVLAKFQEDVEKFTIKSGFSGGSRLDLDGVKVMSKLPSLDELRSKILGLLLAVPTKLVSQINAPAQNIVGVIQAKSDKDKENA